MMNFNHSFIESYKSFNGPYNRDVFATLDARRLYKEACRQGRLSRLWSLITRRPNRLLDLAEVEAACRVHARHYQGVQTVLIEQIRGSEGRSKDFDARFNPRQGHSPSRWISVATAWTMGLELPPVELVQVEDSYFVVDGHHRISVARAMGQEYIEAEIIAWEVSSRSPAPAPNPGCLAAAPAVR